ncbi:MAG TPA: hypothetical protein VM925_13180, partial [Labilithrix sp.]|nr:hypothetical protein [Labilithrix sp.]
PAGLARALAKMVEPDPDRRAASVDEALALLRSSAGQSKRDQQAGKKTRLSRQQKRELRHAKRRAEREERRRRRALARSRRAPFVPRFFAKLGLFIALLAVWIAVGLVAPLVLGLLSLLFGPALRRAAQACLRAAGRSQAALGRASAWLSGERTGDAERDATRVRVDAELDRAPRIADQEASHTRIDDEAWMQEHAAAQSEHLEDDRELRRATKRRP